MGRTRESDAQFQMLAVPNISSGCWPIGFTRGSRVACRIPMTIVDWCKYFMAALRAGLTKKAGVERSPRKVIVHMSGSRPIH